MPENTGNSLSYVMADERSSPMLGAIISQRLAMLRAPTTDLGDILNRIGVKLFVYDTPLTQYLSWCHEYRVFETLDKEVECTIDSVSERTVLTRNGADALLGILSALGLISRSPEGRYALTPLAREYFLEQSPYFIGRDLFPPGRRVPQTYIKNGSRFRYWLRYKFLSSRSGFRYGGKIRLRNQHTRNLASCVAAVNSGVFDGCRSLVDIAGGTGTFAIPLARNHPQIQITLADVPQAIPGIRRWLGEYGMEERIRVQTMDVFKEHWNLPQVDAIFIGNFLHGFSDDVCVDICRRCGEHLFPGGRIWIHEMLWNDNRDGPLLTALWNASMCIAGGKQRTGAELSEILVRAGFKCPIHIPTANGMALIGAEKGNAEQVTRAA